MTRDQFHASLADGHPPGSFDAPLCALWWDAKGEWAAAHAAVAADEVDPDAAWVHAYLHRQEGDRFNAHYWYGRARRPAAAIPLDVERVAILDTLLSASARRA